jgi:hypothetical protein
MGRDQPRCGFLATPMIHHQQVHGVLIVLSKLMQEALQGDGLPGRSRQETAVPGAGGAGALQRTGLDLGRYGPARLDPAHRQASTLDGKPANAAFLLAKNASRRRGDWWSRGWARSPCGRQAGRDMLRKALDLVKVV